MIASKRKPNKDRTGEYIELEIEILDGPQKGRKVWDRLNLKNPSQQAVEIAYRTLSALCWATGVITPNDTSELHDIPMIVTVACKKGDKGKIFNEVKGYKERKKGAAEEPQGSEAPWARNDTVASNDDEIPF